MNEPLSPSALKNASRGISTDMSPEAIARRFDVLQQLNELCDWLSRAKRLGPVAAEELAEGTAQEPTSSPG